MKKYNIFNKKSVLFLGLTMSVFSAFSQQPTVTQQALKYVVCPGAEVTLGVVPENGVTWFWYAAANGGNALNASSSNTLTRTNVQPPISLWVEPRRGSTVYPRVRIDIELSPYCGNTTPTGCAATGKLVYKEDFQGNSTADPVVSPVDLIGGRSDLVFSTSPNWGRYSLMKYGANAVHLYTDDHTYPNDRNRGYYMLIDPDNNQMNAILYEYDILGLCSMPTLNLTCWAVDLSANSAQVSAKFEMQILDFNTRAVLATTGTFSPIRQIGTPQSSSFPAVWRQYGFNFDLPIGTRDITLRLINKETNAVVMIWLLMI